MSKVLTIEKVISTKEELSALPLKAPIRVQFSSEPNLVNADKYIKLLRTNASSGIKSLPESYSDFLTWDESRFAKVEIKKEENNVIAIYPEDVLIEKSDYVLYIGAGLTSSSSRVITDSRLEKVESSIQAELIIEALSDTIKNSAGKDVFVAKISTGSKVIHNAIPIELLSAFEIPGYKVWFKSSASFSKGEKLIIEPVESMILTKDFKLEFSTVSTGSYGEPEVKSEVISKDSIKQFFSQPFPGVANPSAANSILEQEEPKYQVLIRQPNKIYIDFEVPIDPESIDNADIEPEISEAFGNYHLSKMGLYEEDAFYKFTIDFKRKNKRMEITISKIEDKDATENIVEMKE